MFNNKKDRGWILCRSSTFPGKFYYFNVATGETAWTLDDAEKSLERKNGEIQNVVDNQYHPEPSSPPLTDNPTIAINQPTFSFTQNPQPTFGKPPMFPKTSLVKPKQIIWTPIHLRVPIVLSNTNNMPPNLTQIQTNDIHPELLSHIGAPETNAQTPFLSDEHSQSLMQSKESCVQASGVPCQWFVNYDQPVKVEDKEPFVRHFTSTPVQGQSKLPSFKSSDKFKAKNNLGISYLNLHNAATKQLIKESVLNVKIPSKTCVTNKNFKFTPRNTDTTKNLIFNFEKPSMSEKPQMPRTPGKTKTIGLNFEVPTDGTPDMFQKSNLTFEAAPKTPEKTQNSCYFQESLKTTERAQNIFNLPSKTADEAKKSIFTIPSKTHEKAKKSCFYFGESLKTAERAHIFDLPSKTVDEEKNSMVSTTLKMPEKFQNSNFETTLNNFKLPSRCPAITYKPGIHFEVSSKLPQKFKESAVPPVKMKKLINDKPSDTFIQAEDSDDRLNYFDNDLRMLLLLKKRKALEEGTVINKKPRTQVTQKKVTFNLDNEYEGVPSLEHCGDGIMTFTEKYLPMVQSLKNLAHPGMKQDWCLVPDFETLMAEMDFLGGFVQIDQRCRLVIPSAVYREVLLISRGDSRGRTDANCARNVVRCVNSPYVVVQTNANETMEHSMNEAIIQCCKELTRSNIHVILVSNDQKLVASATRSAIHCCTMDNLKNGYAPKPEPVKFKEMTITIQNKQDTITNGLNLLDKELHEQEKESIHHLKRVVTNVTEKDISNVTPISNSMNRTNRQQKENTFSDVFFENLMASTIPIANQSKEYNNDMPKVSGDSSTRNTVWTYAASTNLANQSKVYNNDMPKVSGDTSTRNTVPTYAASTNLANQSKVYNNDMPKVSGDMSTRNTVWTYAASTNLANQSKVYNNDMPKVSGDTSTRNTVWTYAASTNLANQSKEYNNDMPKMSVESSTQHMKSRYTASQKLMESSIPIANQSKEHNDDLPKNSVDSSTPNMEWRYAASDITDATVEFNMARLSFTEKPASPNKTCQNCNEPNTNVSLFFQRKKLNDFSNLKINNNVGNRQSVSETFGQNKIDERTAYLVGKEGNSKVKEPRSRLVTEKSVFCFESDTLQRTQIPSPSQSPEENSKGHNEIENNSDILCNSEIENRLSDRMDEYICSFIQVMEEFLTETLEKLPPSILRSMMAPWSLYEGLQCIRYVYRAHTTVKTTIQQLCGYLYEADYRNDKLKKTISPNDFVKALECGTQLVKNLKNISQESDYTFDAETSLNTILDNIKHPGNNTNILIHEMPSPKANEVSQNTDSGNEIFEVIGYPKKHINSKKDLNNNQRQGNHDEKQKPIHRKHKEFESKEKDNKQLNHITNKQGSGTATVHKEFSDTQVSNGASKLMSANNNVGQDKSKLIKVLSDLKKPKNFNYPIQDEKGKSKPLKTLFGKNIKETDEASTSKSDMNKLVSHIDTLGVKTITPYDYKDRNEPKLGNGKINSKYQKVDVDKRNQIKPVEGLKESQHNGVASAAKDSEGPKIIRNMNLLAEFENKIKFRNYIDPEELNHTVTDVDDNASLCSGNKFNNSHVNISKIPQRNNPRINEVKSVDHSKIVNEGIKPLNDVKNKSSNKNVSMYDTSNAHGSCGATGGEFYNESPVIKILKTFTSKLVQYSKSISELIDASIQDVKQGRLDDETKKSIRLDAFENNYTLSKIVALLEPWIQKQKLKSAHLRKDKQNDLSHNDNVLRNMESCLEEVKKFLRVVDTVISAIEDSSTDLNSSMALNVSS